jgi:flagellar protein FlaG
MSSNISIGRSSPLENNFYPAEGAKQRSNSNVQSTKELKQAELNGQQFSIGEEQLIKAIEQANKALQGVNTSFEFSIHEGTKEIMVKVLNKDTGQVVREIPSEKILDLVARLWEMSGIMVDERR